MFPHTLTVVNYCTFHIRFVDVSHSHNTGKWLQDGDNGKTFRVESLLAAYE